MLLSVEKWAQKVGLIINSTKTVFLLSGKWRTSSIKIKLSSGYVLEKVDDFKYLGTWLINPINDFKARKVAAWTAIKRLNRIWRSTVLSDTIKINVFSALIVSILLYNATTWTVNKTLSKLLDGAFGKLFRYALNIKWDPDTKKSMSVATLYRKYKIQPISLTLLQRRLSFSGHCFRCSESAPQPIMDLLLWEPSHFGSCKRGRRNNYRKQLLTDTQYLDYIDLQNDMHNQKYWKKFHEGLNKSFTDKRDDIKIGYDEWKVYLKDYKSSIL